MTHWLFRGAPLTPRQGQRERETEAAAAATAATAGDYNNDAAVDDDSDNDRDHQQCSFTSAASNLAGQRHVKDCDCKAHPDKFCPAYRLHHCIAKKSPLSGCGCWLAFRAKTKASFTSRSI